MSALAAASPQQQADVGNAEAYAADLYERHQRTVFGFCYKQLRRREDADDAVQTTFVYALLSLRRGVVPELELPWLYTIARNVCSTRRRNGMRRGAYESAQDLDSVQDRLASPERSDAATSEDFTAALRAIPESQRRALLLREWRGLSYDEIGSELGLSQSATEALLFRARQNVAQRLGERTGLRAALQGLPFISFLRNLLQSAAAKTIAVGAGAALTIVAMPAADRQTKPGPAAPVKTLVAHIAARHDGTARASVSVLQPHVYVSPAARHNDVVLPHRSKGGVVAPRHRGKAADVGTPNATAPPASPAQNNASAAAAPAPITVPPASDAVQSLGLPEVSVPQVSVPQVETPVATVPLPVARTTVTVPSVHLP